MLPANVPKAGASRTIRTPNFYFFDRFGSQGNRSPLLLADREMNQFKGRIFDARDPMAQKSFNDHLDDITEGDYNAFITEQESIEAVFNPIRMTISVFRYIHTPEVLSVIQTNRRNLLEATRVISANVVTLGDAHRLHEEFDSVWHSARTDRARDWVEDRLVQIIQAFSDYRESTGTPHPAERRVFHEVGRLQDQIKYIQPVPQDPEDEDDASYPD